LKDQESQNTNTIKSAYFHWSMPLILIFIFTYSIPAIWLLFDGWINDFKSIYWIWGLDEDTQLKPTVKFAIISIIGGILGCGTLDLVSFHKFIAIRKTFDLDHLWGYIMSPLLASMVGLLVYSLAQAGLLVLSGLPDDDYPKTAELGFAAIGFLSGYSWHHVIGRIRKISENMFRNEHTMGETSSSALSATTPSIKSEGGSSTVNFDVDLNIDQDSIETKEK